MIIIVAGQKDTLFTLCFFFHTPKGGAMPSALALLCTFYIGGVVCIHKHGTSGSDHFLFVLCFFLHNACLLLNVVVGNRVLHVVTFLFCSYCGQQ